MNASPRKNVLKANSYSLLLAFALLIFSCASSPARSVFFTRNADGQVTSISDAKDAKVLYQQDKYNDLVNGDIHIVFIINPVPVFNFL